MDHTLFLCNEGQTDESNNRKNVPWLNWDSWRLVRESLFSSSPDLVTSGLHKIRGWRSRGAIPVPVEVTAAIIETRQKDPFFRPDLNESAWPSQEALSMQYCMTIMRLVNGIIEKTRRKNEISIAEAARAIGIPRMLIDIRHESSHRDLPALRLARDASEKALEWLISYYWEPQQKAIPNPNTQKENLDEKIKHRLQKITLCQKAKITMKASKSSLEGECFKSQSSKLKNRLSKLLKNVIRLYSLYSSEVAHILLEFLLSALESSNITEHLEDSRIGWSTENKQTAYDDWKSVVLKLSRREPEVLVTLSDIILGKMEAQEVMNCDSGEHRPLENSLISPRFELLLCLFKSLVPHLKMLTTGSHEESSEYQDFMAKKRKASLTGLLRRCLLISFPENKQLMASALIIAHLIGDISVFHKLKKLSSLGPSNLETISNPTGDTIPLSQLEGSLLCAEEKFELIKQSRINDEAIKPKEINSRPKIPKYVAKSWNNCPTGMLPCTTGFSGRLPFLHCTNEISAVVQLSKEKEFGELKQCNKRKTENAIQELDKRCTKKVKEAELDCESNDRGDITLGVKGHLMIDGVRTKVVEEEFLAIASAVRLLV